MSVFDLRLCVFLIIMQIIYEYKTYFDFICLNILILRENEDLEFVKMTIRHERKTEKRRK